MDSLLYFIAAHLGRRVTSPGGLGGECVDLIELWLRALGVPTIAGNAVDLWGDAAQRDFIHILNGPTNAPQAGDVVVWHRAPSVGIGPFGHCAVCVLADSMRLLTLDQNWPNGSPVALVLHPYDGVTGWLRAVKWDGPRGASGPS